METTTEQKPHITFTPDHARQVLPGYVDITDKVLQKMTSGDLQEALTRTMRVDIGVRAAETEVAA